MEFAGIPIQLLWNRKTFLVFLIKRTKLSENDVNVSVLNRISGFDNNGILVIIFQSAIVVIQGES